MLTHPSLMFGPHIVAPIVITARQWQAAKQHPTQFGDRKNRPSRKPELIEFIKTLNQGAALARISTVKEGTDEKVIIVG